MTKEEYANSPVRNCRTCVHVHTDTGGPFYDYCNKHRLYCKTAVHFDIARGLGLQCWKAKPPRRSLRQWLYDLLWA